VTGAYRVSHGGVSGDGYDRRFQEAAAAGADVHGEASFVESLGVRSVLDAGCGTGRVAIELRRRGLEAVGVDVDAGMLAAARRKAPDIEWHLDDLTTVELREPGGSGLQRFDAAVLAGNVMIFLEPGTEARVVRNLARHLQPGGLLVAGFQLLAGGLDLPRYDHVAREAGLRLVERYATWDRHPWTGHGAYAVSVHRRPAPEST
jgi:SAM-dependent methyltransferase